MITVNNLDFSYDRHTDLIKGMSFEVYKGEIFGFLGPSGAGKSTLQKILCGILRNYTGSVRVLGTEVKHRRDDFYENIGVDFEFPNLYGKFTALENLNYFSSLYRHKQKDAMPYLDRVGLGAHANKKVTGYSKGMKMRLAFVRAILHEPELLFLDEPTSGLDPAYARILKEMIREQKDAGKTVILTTHNMHDAEELCDRVAFIVDGEIKALDRPHVLRSRRSGVEVQYSYLEESVEKSGTALLETLHRDTAFMRQLQSGRLTGIHSKESTLEDVFIELTGRCLQ